MEGVGANHLSAQANLGPSAPISDCTANADMIDALGLEALFGSAAAAAGEIDLKEKSVDVITFEAQAHSTQETHHATQESLSTVKHAAAQTEEAAQIKERADAIKDINNHFVFKGIDSQGHIKADAAGDVPHDHLAHAINAGTLIVRHGNNLIVPPLLGIPAGTTLKWKDPSGVVHNLTVTHFSDDEMQLMHTFVTGYISRMQQKQNDETEKGSRDNQEGLSIPKPKVDLARAHKKHASTSHAQTDQDKRLPTRLREPLSGAEVAKETNAIVEASRAQKHAAMVLEQLILKFLIFVGSDLKKYDNSQTDHRHIDPISRGEINQARTQAHNQIRAH